MADRVEQTRRSAPPAQRLAVLVGSAALALGPVALAQTAAASPAASPSAGAATAPAPLTAVVGQTGTSIALEQLGPTALVPGSQLVVRVRITNTSGAPLSGTRARLFVDSPALTTRASLDAWAAGQGVQGGDRFSGVDGAEQPLGGSLSPGESVEVAFAVDADQLQLGPDFGPRGVTVDVIDASLQRLTALRTFLVWAPSAASQPSTALTVVAPVTAGAPDITTGQLPRARVEEQLGRLRDLLPAMSLPSTSLVVDPALLGPFAEPAQQGASPSATESAGAAPATPGATSSGAAAGDTAADPSASGPAASSDTSSAAPSAAGGTGDSPELVTGTAEQTAADVQAWLASLRGRTTGSTVVLPQGDTDVVATAAAGTSDLLALAVSQARTAVEGEDDQALLWPADPSAADPVPLVVEAAAASRAGGGTDPVPAVLVDARSVDGAVSEAGTSASTATLVATAPDGSSASTTGVLVDAADSALLAAATADDSQLDPAEASARLLADSAVSASSGGGLVVALPRDWDPDPSAAFSVLGQVTSAPWVRATTLPDLLAGASPQAVRLSGAVAPPAAGDAGAPLDAGGLQAAAAAVSTATTVASLVQDPQALLEPVQRSATAAASLGWRDSTEAWRLGLDQLGQAAAALSSGVQIVEGSPITVIDSQIYLPVTIRSTLPQAATVRVQLRSTSLRLLPKREQPSVEVTIPPGGQARAQIPVTAAASGDTSVTVFMTDAAGDVIGQEVEQRVRVRAEWQGRGIAIAAGVAGLVFVVGIVRTVLRVRRRPAPPVVRSAGEADADTPPARRPEESTRG